VLKSIVLCAALALAVTVRLVAGNPQQDHSGQYPQADVMAGAKLYMTLCAGCHGPTGAGVGTVDLRRGPLRRATTDTALAEVISNGVPAAGMPPFRLDSTEVRALVAFVRVGFEMNSNPPGVTLGDAVRGKGVFEGKANCLSCHRVGDKGSDRGPDLTDVGVTRTAAALQRALIDPTGSMRPINRPVRAVKRDGTVITGRRLNEDTYTVQLITDEGRLVGLVKQELREWSVGTTSPMPSYSDLLTPGEFAHLLAYLVSLKGSGT
jgi:putative heme-binding domain-containing protein